MNEQEIRSVLRDIVTRRLAAQEKNIQLESDDVSLVDLGVIDSFGFLELVGELEEKTGVFPDFSEADPDEFTSINGLVKLMLAQ